MWRNASSATLLDATIEPGTILELQSDGTAQERVTVLTEGKVMYTLLNGKAHREMMLLKDWLILAGSQRVILSPNAPLAPVAPVADYPPYIPTAADLLEPAPVVQNPSYGLKTKLSWKIDENNKITAIVIDKGILQVREIRNGQEVYEPDTYYRLAKKMFPDYASWVASLPPGGTITAYENSAPPPTYKLLKAMPFPVGNDYTIVEELSKRWHVNSYVLETLSPLEFLENYVNHRANLLAERNALQNLPENSELRQSLNTQIYYNNTKIRAHESYLQIMKSEQRCTRPLNVFIRQGPKLQLAIDGRYHDVIPITYLTEFYCAGKRATTFEQLGAEMENGRPKLRVIWQGRPVEVTC